MGSESNYSYINKSNISSTSECSTDADNILIKLRRLKIEQQVLQKNVSAVEEELHIENSSCGFYNHTYFLSKLKDSFVKIRNLYEEVKENTCSRENLKEVDVEEVKKDVLIMEEKIKHLKSHIQTELSQLKLEEQKLMKKLNEDPEEVDEIKRSKIRVMPFNKVVPSPVRNIIKSPFKCHEVQQFQEFMINSKNRYGGWIPYNHNAFVQCWQKYFPEIEYNENTRFETLDKFQYFFDEITRKIPGINSSDIFEHTKWYSKYSYLMKRQQIALNKWKSNKEIIKKSHRRSKEKSTHGFVASKSRPNTKDHRPYDDCYMPNPDLVLDNFQYVSEIEHIINNKRSNSVISNNINEPRLNSEKEYVSQSDTDISNLTNEMSNAILSMSGIISENGKEQAENRQRKVDRLRYLNSTVQWSNRCTGQRDPHIQSMDVEGIQRLCIPKWRGGLHYEFHVK